MNKRPRIFLFPGQDETWQAFRQRLIDGIGTDIIIMDKHKFESLIPDHYKLKCSVEDFALVKMTPKEWPKE